MVVDDHPLWRRTMREVFEETDRVEVVADASEGHEALRRVASARPDVVLMDVDMPGLDGVEATRAIIEAHPGTKVLVLSASDARADVIDSLSAGASGYLLKTCGANDIRDGVVRVAAGEVVLPPSLAAYVVDSLRAPKAGGGVGTVEGLSEREREILGLMAQGCSNSAICASMHLSAKTVEGYIASIFTKLGLEPAPDRHRRVLAVLRYVEAHAKGARR